MSEKPLIHPTAIIDSSAELASDVEVGPYAVIGADVEIGSGSWIGPHVVINGPTKIGEQNKIFQFASVGEACQDKKFRGEPTRLVIGHRNVIRESTTLHRGTIQDESETRIGSDNLLMAYVHVAHDCVVGDGTILANNATLAGHVHVGDGAILGGFTGIHQFCKVGAYSMSGMFSAVTKDIPAFVMVQGNLAKAFGLNVEGMRRRGYSKALITLLKDAYKIVYRQGYTLDEAKNKLDQLCMGLSADAPIDGGHSGGEDGVLMREKLVLFIESLNASTRGIVR